MKDMLEPLRDMWTLIKSAVPDNFKPGKAHFNFITVHWLYMIGLTILGSIMVYPAGTLRYIDALFFAAGSATQSGLNTVDINKLNTYQQVVLLLIACVANPIFINTFVVFVRLYWFEQRFDHIVKEAQRARRTRTRSLSVSQARGDLNHSRLEMGVNGRKITVLHHTTKPNGMTAKDPETIYRGMNEKEGIEHLAASGFETSNADSESGESSNRRADTDKVRQDDDDDDDEASPTVHWLGRNPSLNPTFKREITFADEIAPDTQSQSLDSERSPEREREEHHIAFLARQRNVKDQGTTLRIPGPREYDRGHVPREISHDEEDENGIRHTTTNNSLPTSPIMENDRRPATMNDDDHPRKRGITIDEPERPRREQNPSEELERIATANTKDRSHRFNIMSPFHNLRLRTREDHAAGRPSSAMSRNRTFTFTRSQERDMPFATPYLSWQPTIGRNSQFVDLTEEQREELGGIEYRSLKTLAIVLFGYYIGFMLLGIVVLVPWIVRSGTWGPVVDNDGQSRVWWGIFTSMSMFTDLGFTLTPDSMVSFQTSLLSLLFGSFLIIIGNTGFPCMLRFVIWVLSKLVPKNSGVWEELKFLLDHPRRCFTLMFPSKATWWLFWVLVLLNGIDLLFFIILDLNDSVVTVLSPGYRVLNGWFQAVSTRTAGFACVDLADLHPAIQVSYLIMMYISVFPIAISVRRTNVYEEKSLGLWGGEDEEDEEGKSYVGQHLRRQLSFDLWYIFLGLFIIAIVEGGRIQDTNAYAFTMFSVLFEIVSAYGTVGLSLGYPNINASFSAEFATLSKLVIIAMMLRGRHRGLPYALDRAILLPSENLHKREAEDARRRPSQEESAAGEASGARTDSGGLRMHARRPSGAFSTASGVGGGVGAEQRYNRARRLSTVVMAGLSAGPTIANRKYE